MTDVQKETVSKNETVEQAFHDEWAKSVNVRDIDIHDHFENDGCPEAQQILIWMGDLRGKRILELGSGLGEGSVYFATKGANVLATDISKEMLLVAKDLAAQNNVTIETMQLSAMNLERLPDESFDIVYAANLLHHVNIEKCVIQVYQKLKPGGRAYFWDPVQYNPIINIYRKMATKVRTVDEHPIRIKDIRAIQKIFQNVRTRHFWLTSLVIFLKYYFIERIHPNQVRYWKKIVDDAKKISTWLKLLHKIDTVLFSIIPGLKYLSWNIAIEARKPIRSKPMHLVIPMSGQGTRYQEAGYQEPKPLIPVAGRPMIARLLESFPENWQTHFILAENHRSTKLPTTLYQLRPNASQEFVPIHTEGPGRAILRALDNIPDEDAVFVSYCDYGMVWDVTQFEDYVRSTKCDVCIISYRGFHPHYLSNTQYAYCKMEGERVIEVREKSSFTAHPENEYASSGGYYFSSARILKIGLEYQKKQSLSLNGEYYTSLTIEALLRTKPDINVRIFEISAFFQWGTPLDLQRFEYWFHSFNAYRQIAPYQSPGKVKQILMPMAGLGSRFSKITTHPKPLIPIFGLPMFQAALNTFPQTIRTVVVALDQFASKIQEKALQKNGIEVISLSMTPAGQALSTEAGIPSLHPEEEVIVTSCDHGIVLDPHQWSSFQNLKSCDAAIFTIQGYPAARLTPEAFSYVISEDLTTRDDFALMARVSVKKPVSQTPEQDAVLVGTFWFKTPKILQIGINALKKQNFHINGELYLDSIFEYLKAMGYSIRVIPLEGYLCWGDPDSLAEALYWQEIFCGRKILPRSKHPGINL